MGKAIFSNDSKVTTYFPTCGPIYENDPSLIKINKLPFKIN
jgi:hypothetical protein